MDFNPEWFSEEPVANADILFDAESHNLATQYYGDILFVLKWGDILFVL